MCLGLRVKIKKSSGERFVFGSPQMQCLSSWCSAEISLDRFGSEDTSSKPAVIEAPRVAQFSREDVAKAAEAQCLCASRGHWTSCAPSLREAVTRKEPREESSRFLEERSLAASPKPARWAPCQSRPPSPLTNSASLLSIACRRCMWSCAHPCLEGTLCFLVFWFCTFLLGG